MVVHYFSLTWRGALCITLLVLWLGDLFHGGSTIMYHFAEHPFLMLLLWLLLHLDLLMMQSIMTRICAKH